MRNPVREIEAFRRDFHSRVAKENEFVDQKFNMTQIQIMHYLFMHSEEEVCQKDLEDYLRLKKATITESLEAMEEKGLIERKQSGTDRRRKIVTVSEKEREKVRKKIGEMDEVAFSITKDIKEKDMDTFYKVLDKMKENLLKGGTR